MKRFSAVVIIFAIILTVFVSCNSVNKLTSYEDIRQYLLYDHIIYNGTPYYIAANQSPALSEDSYLVHETVHDVIIVDEDGNPYDAERKEEALIYPNSDQEIIYVYFNSAYYTRNKSLASVHY